MSLEDPPKNNAEDVSSKEVKTPDHFESWKKIKMEGGKELLRTIRKNIEKAAKENYAYEFSAKEAGLPVEEFKRNLQERVERIISESDFFVAISPALVESVLNVDGRWKNQFETATSNGVLDLKRRSQKEEEMFGYPNKEHPDIHPIYGYVSNGVNGEVKKGTTPGPTTTARYGTVGCKLKKERALEKATVTFTDSLPFGSEYPPSPAIKPHYTSLNPLLVEPGEKLLGKLQESKNTDWGTAYIEAQYHGGLKVDDIESIHISRSSGMSDSDLEKVRTSYRIYMKNNPDSKLKLVEYWDTI